MIIYGRSSGNRCSPLEDRIPPPLCRFQLDNRTSEGKKLIAFYHLLDGTIPLSAQLDRLPATLLLDPITGARMEKWVGFFSGEVRALPRLLRLPRPSCFPMRSRAQSPCELPAPRPAPALRAVPHSTKTALPRFTQKAFLVTPGCFLRRRRRSWSG